MPLDFLGTPTLNEIYTSGPYSWIWNGSAWVGLTDYVVSGGAQGTGSQGSQGTPGSGTQGVQGRQGPAGTGGGGSGTQGAQGTTGSSASASAPLWRNITTYPTNYTPGGAVNILTSAPGGTPAVGDIWLDISSMGSLAASPGWTKLSNGLILQWGYYATYSAGYSSWTGPINFATTFPNACFGITFGHNSSNSTGGVSTATTSGIAIQTSTLTTSHFYFECGGANADGFYWFAYGY